METQVDKEQMLDRLTRLQKNIQQVKVALRPALLQQIIGHLQELDGLCQQNLSEQRYTYYAEIFQGIEAAMQEVQQAGGRKEVPEVCDMSIELLKFVEKEFCQDPELNGMLRKKKEIVFLPYKASMWDSLESIWRAAAEDQEHCNAYVVPIPYCDRNPDGTAKEWHCEVNLFPKDVPVLDYRTFDLETLHPDVIFIHNPYDDCNMATSVDCAYYSRYLKKYTELLVYVPYFVVGDTIADHFCQAPGIVNADLVIVQDENIKEQYEQYYPGGNPPKGKFLALGSPKFDKVCNTTREDYVLPEKWQKLIGNKKVILYNTSISAMLQHADKFNAKLRYVFGIFKNRDDVVLWWRPHPLLKAAMDSITPAVSAEYRRIEQQYIDEGWGIYDDTPEMDRAIVCTDAYYGDGSSLVCLYQKTGKPILIQDIDWRFMSNGIWFPYLAVDNQFVWFVASADIFVGLYRMDLQSNELKCLGELPITYERNFKYGAIGKIGNKVIIAPYFFNGDFIEFDVKKNVFKSIPLRCDVWSKYGTIRIAFANVVLNKTSLYFIGNGNGLIIEYNAVTDEYSKHLEWSKSLDADISTLNFTWAAGVQKKNIVYLPLERTNLVLKLDVSMFHAEIIQLPVEFSILRMSYDGEKFWLVPFVGNKILCWDGVIIKSIEMPIPSEREMPFINSVNLADDMMFCSLQGREIFLVNKSTYEVSRAIELEKRLDVQKDGNNCWIMDSLSDPKRAFVMYKSRYLLEMEKGTNGILQHEIKRDYQKTIELYDKSIAAKSNVIQLEPYGINLDELLLWCQAHKADIAIDKKTGKTIWQYLKNV